MYPSALQFTPDPLLRPLREWAGGAAGRVGSGRVWRVAGGGPENGSRGDAGFSRLILSRAGFTAARDKINLEKPAPFSTSLNFHHE